MNIEQFIQKITLNISVSRHIAAMARENTSPFDETTLASRDPQKLPADLQQVVSRFNYELAPAIQ